MWLVRMVLICVVVVVFGLGVVVLWYMVVMCGCGCIGTWIRCVYTRGGGCVVLVWLCGGCYLGAYTRVGVVYVCGVYSASAGFLDLLSANSSAARVTASMSERKSWS